MDIVVLGERQATGVAGYIAATTGRDVVLLGPSPTEVRTVGLAGQSHPVNIVGRQDLSGLEPEAVVIVTESRALREVIEPLRHQLAGVPLLLAPGGFGGVLRVRAWFEEWGLTPPLVAEASGFPASGSLKDGMLDVRSIKRRLPMAAEDRFATERLHAVFVQLLPELVSADLATTSLSNTNHMIHPGVVLLNAVRVERGEPFSFYRGGLSPAVGRLIDAVDAERVELANRAGAEAHGVREWLIRFYGHEGMAGEGIVECLKTFDSFENVPSPPSLDYRYLVDDVPHGVAQWSLLARELGLDVPHIDGLLATLRTIAPDLSLEPDPLTVKLFLQHLPSSQGVTA